MENEDKLFEENKKRKDLFTDEPIKEEEEITILEPEIEEVKKTSFIKKLVKKLGRMIAFLVEVVITVIIVLVIYQGITMVVQFGKVEGSSMEPTYFNGDRIVFEKIGEEYEPGDIVVFLYETNNEKYFQEVYKDLGYELSNTQLIGHYHIKRVYGVPGDEIEIVRNKVLVNGEEVLETDVYMMHQKYTLEEGQYFLVGDNFNSSFDSRYHGPVETNQILGEVLYSEKWHEYKAQKRLEENMTEDEKAQQKLEEEKNEETKE